VPQIVGQTGQARTQKIDGSRSPSVEVDWDYYQARLQPDRFALVHDLFERIDKAIKERDLGWVPKLTRGYIGFQRPGGYRCAGVEIYPERPVEFWIKLPLAPDELRRLGHDIPDPYPHLTTHWTANYKQWNWPVPTLEAAPDVAPAIELTSRYQPPNGPMPTPAS
jgi:hypothetical protein